MASTCRKFEKGKNIEWPFEQQKFDHKKQITESRHLVRTILLGKNQRIDFNSRTSKPKEP